VLRVLVVEDDKFKLRAVEDFIREFLPESGIAHADSLQAAYELVQSETFSLIVLDMSIPSYSEVAGSGRPYPLNVGGLDILLEVWTTERTEKVIILTQFPDIEFDQIRHPVDEFLEFAHTLGITNLVASLSFDTAGIWKHEAKKALNIT
jgi:CheY-like chemotaxis protein